MKFIICEKLYDNLKSVKHITKFLMLQKKKDRNSCEKLVLYAGENDISVLKKYGIVVECGYNNFGICCSICGFPTIKTNKNGLVLSDERFY